MNVHRIKMAAERIEQNAAALKWLKEYGAKLFARDSDGFRLTFRANFANSCAGAKEAQEVISAMARFEIEAIVKASISNCENTIVLDQGAIREELARAPCSPEAW